MAISTIRMPALFIGHGSPMNALEDNRYTEAWAALASAMPKPTAILVVSAHWTTSGSAITADTQPKTIHDFGGFPQALFDINYPAVGDPQLAASIRDFMAPIPVRLDSFRGIDHGAWSVLIKMYPHAEIPVLQLSIDTTQPTQFHFALGQRLSALRDQGILLIGTGNVVHNLSKLVWGGAPAPTWAIDFNERVRATLLGQNPECLTQFAEWGMDAALSVPTVEHFLPLLYIAGSKRDDDLISIPIDGIEMGAISMMAVVVGAIPSA